MKQESLTSNVRWVVLLFVGIAVGGTTMALERIFDIARSTLMDAVVGASILTVLVSFLGFMARHRE